MALQESIHSSFHSQSILDFSRVIFFAVVCMCLPECGLTLVNMKILHHLFCKIISDSPRAKSHSLIVTFKSLLLLFLRQY